MTEHEYDRINNEGGEGYNPIRAARQDAEAAKAARQHGPLEEAERAMIAAKGLYGYKSPEHNAASDAYFALVAEREERKLAEFAIEWTREVTIERRAAWNAAAANAKTTAEVIERVGFGPDNLRRAIALHNL